jgi:ankyrin repeat protein
MLVDAGAYVDAFHLRLALRAENLDDETRDDISACVDALLRRGVPEYSGYHVKRFLQENNAAAAEILYSRGIGLPDESAEAVNEFLQVILDLPPTEYENKSLTFLLTHYRDIIRGSRPEKVIAKILASRHMSNKAIVNLMNPSINIKWRGKKGKTLLHIFAENMRWHSRAFDFSVLHALLDRGINVNARAKGGLAVLHILVADNYVSSGSDEVWFANVLGVLLSKGLDINAVDNKGWTALDYLSNSQVVDRCAHRVGALVQRGLNADIRDTVASRRRPRSHPRRTSI